MGRIRLTVRYDGTDFAGSQIQPGRRTVAGTLKAGLESLLDQEVKLDFAGRTDTGVHANGNVCAFDAKLLFGVGRLPLLLNKRLPDDVVVRDAREAAAEFHPRYDAKWRTYLYRCCLSADVPVHLWRYAGVFRDDWDTEAIRAALPLLEGRHSFAAFSASKLSPADSVCELKQARMTRRGAEVTFRFTANRYLRHMIVRLVGALALIGEGKLEAAQLQQALGSSRLEFQLRPAPAKGLTLDSVKY